MTKNTTPKQRLRAPSQRSLENRSRILDAAEAMFAHEGFAGATIRDIAKAADVPVSLVHHHGGGKEALFREVVGRRAEELSTLRLAALNTARARGPLTLAILLDCFFRPYLEKAEGGDPQWLAYARLVAMVSADPAWADISEALFDPTARRFMAEIGTLYPAAGPARVAEAFIYSVAAMLALLTSQWRVAALAGDPLAGATLDGLVAYCAAGCAARLRA